MTPRSSGVAKSRGPKSLAPKSRTSKAVVDKHLYDGLFVRWMGRLEADLPMIFEIARQTRGPVLELGVGPGRVAIPLARRGFRVTGVDNSAAMLDEARARLAQTSRTVARRVTLLESDLRRLNLPAGFRLALLPFNTLCHFESLDEQDRVLAGASRALVPGGHLWISVFHLDPARPLGVVRAEPSPLPGESPGLPGSRTEAFFQQTYERSQQITEARYWLDTVGTDGLLRRDSLTLRLRWFHRFELERLVRAHGFQVRRVFGDFDGSDFADTSPQLIVLARKR